MEDGNIQLSVEIVVIFNYLLRLLLEHGHIPYLILFFGQQNIVGHPYILRREVRKGAMDGED